MTIKITDEQFIECWKKHFSPTKVALELGINVKNIHVRRARLVSQGHVLPTFDLHQRKTAFSMDEGSPVHFEKRRQVEVVFSYKERNKKGMIVYSLLAMLFQGNRISGVDTGAAVASARLKLPPINKVPFNYLVNDSNIV